MTSVTDHDNELLLRRLRRLEEADRTRRKVRKIAVYTVLSAVVAAPAIAGAVDVPNAFSDGDPIEADQFNENFTALGDALTTVETTVASLGPPITGSTNIDVAGNVISLTDEVTTEGNLTVNGGHITIPIPGPSTWNNAGGGATALFNTVNHSSCDEASERGSIRVWVLDESTPDGDNHDALCYCRLYHDDTSGTDTYRWTCLHGASDGT